MNVYFVLLIQILVASGTHIVAKSTVQHVDALTLTFLRGILSAVGLALLLSIRKNWPRIERRDRASLVFLGFLATLNQFLYLFGIRYTTAANAALLYAATPVFVLILSRLFLGEPITLRKSAGILLAFIGVSLVIFERGIDFSSEFTLGNLIIVVAVVAWALFTILGRPMVLRYGALPATSVANFTGLALLFPFGMVSTTRFPLDSMNGMDWFGVVYLGIGTSIIGYLLWYYALGRIEAGQLAVFANGQPIVAAIFSAIFLDYAITPIFMLGAAITITGVILAQVKERSQRERNPAGGV